MIASNEGGHESHRVGRSCPNRCHNCDDDVFLDGKWSGVERDTEDLDLRNDACPESEEREGYELGYDLRHVKSATETKHYDMEHLRHQR